MRPWAFVPALAVAGGLAVTPAEAACTYGGCPDWPSDCYNLKKTEWCPKDGVSTVTMSNHGSYESAFDWARTEISDPHDGVANSLTMTQVASGGQIKVFDYSGSADWWGLADQYVTTNGTCLKSARIQIHKSYMTSTVRKKYTMVHELGHAVGLNHVCVCPRTMNPCGTCGDDANGTTPYIDSCTAKGLAAKYPLGDVVPLGDEEILDQAHLLDSSVHSDVDGDGRSDVCARNSKGVVCYLSTGAALSTVVEGPALSDESGWGDLTNATTLRLLDMDGDGRADFCARANAGIRCWKSTGTAFSAESIVGPELSDDASWGNPIYFTTLRAADFDGDGKDDLCARAAKGIVCYASTGSGFSPAVAGPELSNEAGWNAIERYATIQMGDVDGDGRADVCGRDATGMRCWLSDGSGFPKEIAGPEWTDAGGWKDAAHFSTIRLADVDGDGKADLCARAADAFRCHLSTGDGFGEAILGPAWSNDSGWNDVSNYSTIRLGDLDGDRDLDICARANAGILCALWEGSGFGSTFAGPELTDGKGWIGPEYFRTLRLADVDADSKADFCARHGKGFRCWLSDGAGFPSYIDGPEWSDAAGWSDPKYYATIRLSGTLAPPAVSGVGSGGAGPPATGPSGLNGSPMSDGGVEGGCSVAHPVPVPRSALALVSLLVLGLARRRRSAFMLPIGGALPDHRGDC